MTGVVSWPNKLQLITESSQMREEDYTATMKRIV